MGIGVLGTIVVEVEDVSLEMFLVELAALEFNQKMTVQYILEQYVGTSAVQDNLSPNEMESSLK